MFIATDSLPIPSPYRFIFVIVIMQVSLIGTMYIVAQKVAFVCRRQSFQVREMLKSGDVQWRVQRDHLARHFLVSYLYIR